MIHQSIQQPFGITVFGSAVIHVDPDIAQVLFSVYQTDFDPKDAFKKTHTLVANINSFLAENNFKDVGTSQITLSEASRNVNNEYKFLGYTSQVSYQVILKEPGHLESLLQGVIGVGVNRIEKVSFQTSRLKELRAQARQEATKAAREKAHLYSEAAGVPLGKVLHIEDVNPDTLRIYEGRLQLELPPADNETLQVFNPSSIAVRGAVLMSFAIGN